MIAGELITTVISPLKTSDTLQKAFDRMAEFRVNHLPIVKKQQFLGIISDEDIIETADHAISIDSLNLALSPNASIKYNQHIYDVIRLFCEQRLSIVPVVDQEGNYLGLISINTMMDYMGTLTSAAEPGGIIVLEISNRENSLAHMAQIVESNNAQILSSYVRSFPDSTRLEVTFKLNRTDISDIVSSFQRYNYQIKEMYNYTGKDSGSQDRYDQLMNYLNV